MHFYSLFSNQLPAFAAAALLSILPFTTSCSDSDDPAAKEDSNCSAVSEDTVKTKSDALESLRASTLDLAVTGDAYNIQSSTASIPARFNTDEQKRNSAQIAIILTDNPTKTLEFGKGCTEIYIKPSTIDDDGICIVYASNLVSNATYRYRAYYRYNSGESQLGEIKTFTTLVSDHFSAEAVDLGLSVLWASANLGADRSYQAGLYYFYGVPDRDATLSSVSGKLPQNDIAGTSLDPAHVELGDGWSSPTQKQILELINSCTWIKSSLNGYNGYEVHGVGDYYGNYIFIPLAGCYNLNDDLTSYDKTFKLWGGQISSSTDRAISLELNADGSQSSSRVNTSWRLPIRPVKSK